MAERICGNSLVTRNRKLIKKSKIKNQKRTILGLQISSSSVCDVATSSLSHDVALSSCGDMDGGEMWVGGE